MTDSLQNTEALIFDSYPHGGRQLLGPRNGSTCRHDYGLKFMQLTKQTRCAYCNVDLVASYEIWLTMALDHVIPITVCKAWVMQKWGDDFSNSVLCCTACNTFDNRYQPKVTQCPSTLDEFYDLRDRIYRQRRDNIQNKHKLERVFFDQKPWIT